MKRYLTSVYYGFYGWIFFPLAIWRELRPVVHVVLARGINIALMLVVFPVMGLLGMIKRVYWSPDGNDIPVDKE